MRIQCDLPSFNSQEMFNVTLKGNLSFDWYIKVRCVLSSMGVAITVQSPGLVPILLSPQTSHNYLLLVSTAEIMFNDSVFALLPGQGMFVKSQVPVSGMVGWGGSGGWREEEAGWQISSLVCREKCVGREARPVVAVVDYREEFTLEFRELFRSLGCIHPAVPTPFLSFLP